jgi:hypothetical protein
VDRNEEEEEIATSGREGVWKVDKFMALLSISPFVLQRDINLI